MSRLFASAGSDQIVYPSPGAMTGAQTLLVVVKFATASGWASLIEFENTGGADRVAMGRNPNEANNLYWANSAASLLPGGVTMTSTTVWQILAITKAAGTTTPKAHKLIIGGADAHTNQTGTMANALTSAGGTLRLGGNADFADIRLAVAAVWDGTALADADLDGIKTAGTTASIAALSPTWLVDGSDGFATDLVGANHRTTDTGTAADADDPAGWVYGLGAAVAAPGPRATFNAIPLMGRR